ncbi:MAG: hypothetical protein ABIP61_16815 [Burkholderiaceae bacterium]
MNLIALPALTANCTRTSHTGCQAVFVAPDTAAPGAAAPGAQRLAPSAILVTRHRADPDGDIGSTRTHRNGPVGSARRKPLRRSGTALDRERRFGSFMHRRAAPAQACRVGPMAVRRGFDQPVSVPAALRQWKNDFR